ncbi:MAG: Pelagibacter phage, partial [Pseudomonadota bacterium]
LAIGQAPQARITERSDKSYSTQVYYSMDIGATRMEEERVVQILCAEA